MIEHDKVFDVEEILEIIPYKCKQVVVAISDKKVRAYGKPSVSINSLLAGARHLYGKDNVKVISNSKKTLKKENCNGKKC